MVVRNADGRNILRAVPTGFFGLASYLRRNQGKCFQWLAAACVCVPGLFAHGQTPATVTTPQAPRDGESSFIRLKRDSEGQAIALQTAKVRYQSPKGKGGIVVDLIGVVHIGDRTYYEQFNAQFRQYDALLYELVAPEGTRIPKGGRSKADNPISMMQGMAQSVLGLHSQMDHIDYSAKNFVHADMSPAEMAEAMKQRGDNGLTFLLGAAADVIRQANIQAEEMEAKVAAGTIQPIEQVDFMSMLTDANAGEKLKRQMAEQFGAMGSPDMALGATINRSLIQDRNSAAMRVLQREVAAGHQEIGIFYGAAHMPDFERRLQEEFGLVRVRTTWMTAWDLTQPTQPTASPLQMMLQLLEP